MVTPAGMSALRRAATLVHTLPGLRLRLRDGRRTLLEVTPPPLPEGPAACPCAFRRAVTRAHEDTKRGVLLSFVGMAAGSDPAVDVGVPVGDAVLAGGIYRVTVGSGEVHGFATTLPPRLCRDLTDRRVETGADGVRLHFDAATEVTFVHTVGDSGCRIEHHALLEELLGAFVADEVAMELLRATGR